MRYAQFILYRDDSLSPHYTKTLLSLSTLGQLFHYLPMFPPFPVEWFRSLFPPISHILLIYQNTLYEAYFDKLSIGLGEGYVYILPHGCPSLLQSYFDFSLQPQLQVRRKTMTGVAPVWNGIKMEA